ncbi:MAG: hypothetical protein MUC89_02515 [Acetobacteraceae bacterium]|jgi:hypothetical protein|nr:hypothetical protein [Acetobacteraceae bacterium]
MIRIFAALSPLLLLAASLAGAAAVSLRPVPGAPLLAWFPPGADAPLAAARAGGLPVSSGPGGSVLVRGENDLAARLASAGAWLVIRADALGGCLLPDGFKEMPG